MENGSVSPSAMEPSGLQRFVDVLLQYAGDTLANFKTLISAQPEDQLKPTVSELLHQAGRLLGLNVTSRTEVDIDGVVGRPDLGVAVDDLLVGSVELKAPEKSLDWRKFRGHDRQQFERFMALPNLIYTNGRAWVLYRSGVLVRSTTLPFEPTVEEAKSIDPKAVAPVLDLLAQFLGWKPSVPSDPLALATMLAPLARLLRDEVKERLLSAGALSDLAEEWRKVFYPESDDESFADAYAQTLTYALLLAKLEGAPSPLEAGQAADVLDKGHGLLAQVLRVLAQAEARRPIDMPVDLLERVVDAVDPKALQKGGRDPWIYFYEHFLAAYDNEQRMARGVFYTPLPVVRAQVRFVEDLLVSEFGKSDRFADNQVVVLDPAAGTGTYVVEIIARTLARVERDIGPGAVPEAANVIARNLYAFEILVGPYAVAHLRVSRTLVQAGAALPDRGANVFLTDTLSGPVGEEFVAQAPLFEKPLARETVRASRVKGKTRVWCCIGNPPYDRDESQLALGRRRKGGMVRYDVEEPAKRGIIDAYVAPLRSLKLAAYAKSLYNDYVYFWRWASWKVFEQDPAAGGVVTFITASSYLSGPGFSGMREELRRWCSEVWIVDLGGEGRGARVEENVFDIRTPVAIAVGVRKSNDVNQNLSPANVRYRRVGGTREEKYLALDAMAKLDPDDPAWVSVAAATWSDPLTPTHEGTFADWPAIDQLLPWRDTGSHFYRNWPISESRTALERRWAALASAPLEQKPALLKESRDRKVTKRYPDVFTGVRLGPLSGLGPNADSPRIRRYGWRTLDREWCIPDGRVGDYLRPQLWRVATDRQLFLQTLMMSALGTGPAASVFDSVPDCHAYRGSYGDKGVFPMWRDGSKVPNVTHGLLDLLSELYGEIVRCEDLYAYVYGLLGTGAYSVRFEKELDHGRPRIPVPRDGSLFRRGTEIGSDLIWWHTYGERYVPRGCVRGALPLGSAKAMKPVGPRLPEEWSYSESGQSLRVGEGVFAPVATDVWNYEVSGHKVIPSWLDYRKAQRAGKSSSPLDGIRPGEWDQSAELVRLLSIIEHTLRVTPDASELIDEILSSETVPAGCLPVPVESERTNNPPALGQLDWLA